MQMFKQQNNFSKSQDFTGPNLEITLSFRKHMGMHTTLIVPSTVYDFPSHHSKKYNLAIYIFNFMHILLAYLTRLSIPMETHF